MKLEGIYGAVLEIYQPYFGYVKDPGTVIVFPGGGYEHLSSRESGSVARAFQSYGIRAAVLYYDTETELLGRIPFMQAAWAVGKVRELYPEEPVYVLGFSAGAHCAANLGVQFIGIDCNGKQCFREVAEFLNEHRKEGAPLLEIPEERKNRSTAFIFDDPWNRFFRPDRMVLAYPVITSGYYAHRGSIERLIGTSSEAEKNYGRSVEYELALRWVSLETQVTLRTPPTFLWQTEKDEAVPVQNSILFMQSLVENCVPAELHIYPKGAHGLSLATGEVEQLEKGRIADAHVAEWFGTMIDWLRYPL